MPIETGRKAEAYPTKSFFVRMITRDISLEDCILDLIDNAIDAAWSKIGSRPMSLADDTDLSQYRIEIEVSPDKFLIRDNCGGMSLDNAANHAFSFGRNRGSEQEDFSIGVYGIGMKRAVFKIGKRIRVRNTVEEEDGSLLSFAVPINVDAWLSNDAPPWDFDIVSDEALESPGVEIVVEDLNSGSQSSFSSPAFIQNLRRTLARDYSIHLQRGLTLCLNGLQIEGWRIELQQSDDFAPLRLEYSDQADGDTVSVEIIGGMAAPPPEDIEPDESNEGDKRFGWYVVCNGRIVLAADKSSVTGWGTDGWPQWHYQYAGFIGVILFTAANAAALPLTTTKRSVDSSSEVFRRAKPKMREVSKSWIAYTNQRKQALVEAKQKESAARAIPISAVLKRDTVALPSLTKSSGEKAANISYSVPVTRLKKLAKELGSITMTYREVGVKSFEYAFDDLVGDE